MKTPKQIAQELIAAAPAMQLATQKDGKLWLCTVTPAVGEDGCLYWMSLKTTRHSTELEANPNTAVALVPNPAVRQGVQMQGTAQRVTGNEIALADKIYSARYGDSPERLTEAQSDAPSARTYYKFTPSQIALFDIVNKFDSGPYQKIL